MELTLTMALQLLLVFVLGGLILAGAACLLVQDAQWRDRIAMLGSGVGAGLIGWVLFLIIGVTP